MKPTTKPTRDPLPADHGARVVAHYMALSLFLLTLLVVAATPPEPELRPEPARPSILDRVLDLASGLL